MTQHMGDTAPSLATLPQEIFEEIAIYLSRKSILPLSRVCKSLRYKALPLLFKRIRMCWDGGPFEREISITQGGRIDKLFLTFLNNPTLCDHVREFDFSNCYKKPSEQQLELSIFMTNADLVIEKLRAWNLPRFKIWDNAIRNCQVLPYIALLLWLCPKVNICSLERILYLDNPFILMLDYQDRLQGMVDFSASMNVDADSSNYGLGFDQEGQDLWPHFSLFNVWPNLRALTLTRTSISQWPDSMLVANFNLRKLSLMYTDVSPKLLGRILEPLKSLSNLAYVPYVEDQDGPLNCEELQLALRHVKGTLRYLLLHGRFWANSELEVVSEDVPRSIGRISLSEFPDLVVVKIEWNLLFGWDGTPEQVKQIESLPNSFWELLPTSLERLELRLDDRFTCNVDRENFSFTYQCTEPAIIEAFQCPELERRRLVPRFRKFYVYGPNVCERLSREFRERLITLCDRTGLTCRFEDDHFDAASGCLNFFRGELDDSEVDSENDSEIDSEIDSELILKLNELYSEVYPGLFLTE